MAKLWTSVDPVQFALWLSSLCLFVGLSLAVYVVAANVGARNLVFAVASIGGAVFFFWLNLYLELRSSTYSDRVTMELDVDPDGIYIHPTYDPLPLEWHGIDVSTRWLASNLSVAVDKELIPEVVMYSIAVFLMSREPDWHMKPAEYKGRGSMTLSLNEALFLDNRKCTQFTGSDFRKRLTAAGNRYAAAPGLTDDTAICLPPKTTIEISQDTFIIKNPICQVSLRMGYGSAFAEFVLTSLRAETTFFAWHAHDSEINKYRDWSTRIVQGVKNFYTAAL